MMRTPLKFDDMSFKNHHLEGFVWPILSSRTGKEYKITLTSNGFECTCVGAQMHGKCKHIREVHDQLVADD